MKIQRCCVSLGLVFLFMLASATAFGATDVIVYGGVPCGVASAITVYFQFGRQFRSWG